MTKAEDYKVIRGSIVGLSEGTIRLLALRALVNKTKQ